MEATRKLLLKKTLTCPMCQSAFEDLIPRKTQIKMLRSDPDMRRYYQDIEPMWYAVSVCPQCNFANLNQGFDKLSVYEKRDLKNSGYSVNSVKFSGYTEPRDVNQVIEAYALLLDCMAAYNKGPAREGMIWRRLSWIYSDLEDRENYATALDMALGKYLRAYNTSPGGKANELHLNTIIAEIYIAKNDKNKAYQHYIQNLNLLRQYPLLKQQHAALAKQASDRIQDLRENNI